MYLLGFIGVGSMGGGLARAACTATAPEQIVLSNRTASKADALAHELGCRAAEAKAVAAEAKFIFLGVKPKDMAACLDELRPVLSQRPGDFVLVSMAAGLDTNTIQALAGHPWPVIRLCPNTPAAIGKGLVAWCSKDTSPADEAELAAAMTGCGLWDACPESLMDVASVLGGCTPAFTYMFIEALSDGAVRCGISRDKAIAYAAKAVEGAAALCGQGKAHPGALKDAVCSPGGSTIEGVLSLEGAGFRAAAAGAITAAFDKTKRMAK